MHHGSVDVEPCALEGLPPTVVEIAEVVGREKALRLIGSVGASGQRSWRVCFYVPKRIPPDHHLVRVLGWDDAQRFVRHFGGSILQPSNCNFMFRRFRKGEVLRRIAAGESYARIGEVVGLSVDHIRWIVRREEAAQSAGQASRGA